MNIYKEGINKNIFKEKFNDIKGSDYCLMKTKKDYLLRLKMLFLLFSIIFCLFVILPEIFNFIFYENPKIFKKIYISIIMIFVSTFITFIVLYFIETKWLYISRKYFIDIWTKSIIENKYIKKVKLFTIIKTSNKYVYYTYYIEIYQNYEKSLKYKISLQEYIVIPYLFKEKLWNIEVIIEKRENNFINKSVFINKYKKISNKKIKDFYLKMKIKFTFLETIEKYIKKYLLKDNNTYYESLKERYYKNWIWIFN